MNAIERMAAKEKISKKGPGSSSSVHSRTRTPMRKIVIKDEMRSTGAGTAMSTNGEDLQST